MSRRAYCSAKLNVITIQQVTTVKAASPNTRGVLWLRRSTAVMIVKNAIPAITIGGGGAGSNGHALSETFDTTDSWKGTQNALLLAIALAER